MDDISGLNNRVFQLLSQKSSKAAVDLLGMRLSTNFNGKFTEILITETEAFGRANTDQMSLATQLSRKIPKTLPLGPPSILIMKSYGSNKSLYLLTSKKGTCEAVLIRSGKILLGKNYIEVRRKTKMKTDNLTGPGNVTKALGITLKNDGDNILDGPISLSPRIHPADKAIAKQRKNSKPRDKNLWRFSLILKWNILKNDHPYLIQLKITNYYWNLRKNLELNLGFSHPISFEIPEDLKIEVPKPTTIKISGIDKQRVGQIAANIRSYRKPEPYKGKGVKYKDEYIRRKEGKKK